MANLGFVGMGVMGGLMAEKLLGKGHQLTGYNRTKSKSQPLIDRGMKWADSPRAVAQAADVIFSSVTNSEALLAITEGPDGILAGIGPGKVYVDMSTVSVATSRKVAAKIREKGADMMDSPVSGTVATLQQGKLSVMVAGRRETFDRVKPILEDLSQFPVAGQGNKVTYVGDNGLALVMKIATNLNLAVQMLAFSEAVLLAEKSGIARQTAVDVLTHSAIASPMVQYRGPVRGEAAGRGVVQRQHDAEGHAAGAGAWPASGRAAADHRGDQRISYRGARHGLGARRFRGILTRWHRCRECPDDHDPNPTRSESRRSRQTIAAHVPPDGGDPRVRRAGQRSVPPRADARPHASVPRRGSRRRGHLRSAAAR